MTSPERDELALARVARHALRQDDVREWHRRVDAADGELRRLETLRAALAAPPRSAPRSTWPSVVALVAAALALLAVAATLVRTMNDAPDARAVRRVLAARADGRVGRDSDLDAMRRIVADPTLVASLLRDPRSPEEWRRLDRRIPDVPRDGAAARADLLAPRAGVTASRPVFVFVTRGLRPQSRLAVRIARAGAASIEVAVDGAAPGGEFRVELPTGVELAASTDYAWTVVATRDDHADAIARPVHFHVVPEDGCNRLGPASAVGDVEVDAIVRAAALLECDLAEDAMAVLRDARSTLPIARLLEADALARLGDRDAFDALHAGRP